MRDLAEIHGFAGSLFTPSRDREFSLTPEQVAHFEEFGYVSGVRLLDDAQVDVLRDELARLASRDHPGHSLFYEFHSNESANPDTVLFHALGAWRIEPGFHDILWNPRFVRAAEQLLGGPVRFWHDQLFSKPAKHGGVVAWHQDYSYWTRTKPLQHLTCWIGLDDSTVENGCLHYVPASHRWPLLPITGLAGNMDEVRTVLNEEQLAAFKPIPIELKKGEATFHHALLMHGSFENRSERPRRATVINVFRDGTFSDTNETLLDGVPVIPAGQPMEGRFFPRLSSAPR